MKKLSALFLTSTLFFVGCGESQQSTEEQLAEALNEKNAPEAEDNKKEDKTTDKKIEELESTIKGLEEEILTTNDNKEVEVLEKAIVAAEEEIVEVVEEVAPATFSAYDAVDTFLGKFLETVVENETKIHKLEVTDVEANNPLGLKFVTYLNETTGKLILASGGDSEGITCVHLYADCMSNCHAVADNFQEIQQIKGTIFTSPDNTTVTVRDIPQYGVTAKSYYNAAGQCINVPEGRNFDYVIKGDPYQGEYSKLVAPVSIRQD